MIMVQYMMLVVLQIIIFVELHAQRTDIIDARSNPGLIIDEIPSPPPNITGSYFLFDNYTIGQLKLATSNWEGQLPTNFDLFNNLIEVRTSFDIRIASIDQLDYFILRSSNGQTQIYESFYKYDSTQTGIIQLLLSNNEFSLIKHELVVLLKPNYNAAIDSGNPNKRFVRQNNTYLVRDEKILKFKRKYKSIAKLFPDHASRIKTYLGKNDISLENDSELIETFNFISKQL